MTKEEAYAQNSREMSALLTPSDPDCPGSFPLFELIEDLQEAKREIRKDGVVDRDLPDTTILLRALCAPSLVTWMEPGEGTSRDPVSGKLIPAMKRMTGGGAGVIQLNELKYELVDYVRTMAGHAKRIGSPSLADWRETYLSLVEWSRLHGTLGPMDEAFATEIVDRVRTARVALWADNEIEKEARHV